MMRNEFVTQLTAELHKRNVAAADAVEEYQQHFAFKLADGYSEEEIAARLGDPVALAAQFGEAEAGEKRHSAVLTQLWLVWADLFFGAFAVLLLSFGVVPTVFVLLIIRGFFRRNQEQYRKFAAAGTWREAIA